MKIGTTEVLEADNYDATFVDYTDQKPDGTALLSVPFNGEGDPKPQWRLTFELDEPSGRQLSAWVNKPAGDFVSPKAKIVQVAKALIPNLTPNDDWDLEGLLHKKCRLQVEVYDKSDGSQGNKITGFLPPKGATAARQPVAAGARSEPVPTVAQRRAAAAVADPRVDEDDAPPF